MQDDLDDMIDDSYETYDDIYVESDSIKFIENDEQELRYNWA